MVTSRIVAVAAVVVLTGALTAEAQEVSDNTNRDRRVITTAEIEAARVNTAYQVVEKVRPEFLNRLNRRVSMPAGMVTRGRTVSSRGSTNAGGRMEGGGSESNQAQSDPPDPAPEMTETPTAAVFVDGTNMGGLDELQRIQSTLVEEIRYLSGADAAMKYGPRFSAGVLEVKLKNR
jgi:hypothetical protein